jgi:hypothetical protein
LPSWPASNRNSRRAVFALLRLVLILLCTTFVNAASAQSPYPAKPVP